MILSYFFPVLKLLKSRASDGMINFWQIYLLYFLNFPIYEWIIITYLALCSAERLLFSSAWSTSISFFFLSMLRSARSPALACVNLNLLYSFSCSSSCCLSLCRKWERKGQTEKILSPNMYSVLLAGCSNLQSNLLVLAAKIIYRQHTVLGACLVNHTEIDSKNLLFSLFIIVYC